MCSVLHPFNIFFRCFGEDVCINIPDIDAYVMVLQANEPKITISGMDHFARPAAQFESERGVILLPDIRIASTVTKMEHSKKNDGGMLISFKYYCLLSNMIPHIFERVMQKGSTKSLHPNYFKPR